MELTDTEAWTPEYSSWRHGGWYVDNIRYPGGAVGCVSRNYADRKWRIVCDKREGEHTYPNRDAAARAEHAIAQAACAAAPKCPSCGHAFGGLGCSRGACPNGRSQVEWAQAQS